MTQMCHLRPCPASFNFGVTCSCSTIHCLQYKIQVSCHRMCTGEWELGSTATTQCEEEVIWDKCHLVDEASNNSSRLQEAGTLVRAFGSSVHTCNFVALTRKRPLAYLYRTYWMNRSVSHTSAACDFFWKNCRLQEGAIYGQGNMACID